MLEATIKANTEKKMELESLIRRLSEKGIDDREAAEEGDAAVETESEEDDDSDATP